MIKKHVTCQALWGKYKVRQKDKMRWGALVGVDGEGLVEEVTFELKEVKE